MRVGVLGTGMVGRTIGSRLAELGHEVRMGSRRAGNEAAVEWAASRRTRAVRRSRSTARPGSWVCSRSSASDVDAERQQQAVTAEWA